MNKTSVVAGSKVEVKANASSSVSKSSAKVKSAHNSSAKKEYPAVKQARLEQKTDHQKKLDSMKQ